MEKIFEICGEVAYPGANEIVCVAPKDHPDDAHNWWPRECVFSESNSVNFNTRSPDVL